MPTWVKVVLIVVLTGFVVLAVGVFLAARWVRQRGVALNEEGKAVIAQARAFGVGKDGEACIAESMTRLRTSQGFIGEAKVKVFLQHCLETATVAPELCADVPPPNEILKSARWTLDQCAKRGRPDDQRCTRVIGALQMRCRRS
jgi:hypothetical protein